MKPPFDEQIFFVQSFALYNNNKDGKGFLNPFSLKFLTRNIIEKW